jgi:hypothetical protein
MDAEVSADRHLSRSELRVIHTPSLLPHPARSSILQLDKARFREWSVEYKAPFWMGDSTPRSLAEWGFVFVRSLRECWCVGQVADHERAYTVGETQLPLKRGTHISK